MLRDKLNLALIAGIVIAICGILIYSPAPAVKAGATTITIGTVADYQVAVSTISFPAGAPGATIADPTNNADETQVLTATATEATPIALLNSDTACTISYTITSITTWGEAVAMEELHTIAVGAELTLADFQANGTEITVWGTPASGQSIAVDTPLELYLTVDLGTGYGKSGTSTLTILGEG